MIWKSAMRMPGLHCDPVTLIRYSLILLGYVLVDSG